MTETDYEILRLLWDDPKIGTIIGRIAIIGLIVSIILERKTKIKPWTHLIQWIGKTANAPIMDRVDQLGAKVDALQKSQAEAKADSDRNDKRMAEDMELDRVLAARRRILRFSDEITNQMPHSQEMFNDILEDCDLYEQFYDGHPGMKNGRARMAVQNIKECYKERTRLNDFLVGKKEKEAKNERKTFESEILDLGGRIPRIPGDIDHRDEE